MVWRGHVCSGISAGRDLVGRIWTRACLAYGQVTLVHMATVWSCDKSQMKCDVAKQSLTAIHISTLLKNKRQNILALCSILKEFTVKSFH